MPLQTPIATGYKEALFIAHQQKGTETKYWDVESVSSVLFGSTLSFHQKYNSRENKLLPLSMFPFEFLSPLDKENNNDSSTNTGARNYQE